MEGSDTSDRRTQDLATPASSGPAGRRWRRTSSAVYAVVVAAIIVAAVLVTQLWPRATDPAAGPDPSNGSATDDPPGADEPSAEPTLDDAPEQEPNPGIPPGDLVTVADLGVEVMVIDDNGTVQIYSPDGSQRTLVDGLPDATQLRLVTDTYGGIVWQTVDNSADIVRVDPDGNTSVLLAGGEHERTALVGFDHSNDGALVIHTVGSHPDDMTGNLLSVVPDREQAEVVRAEVVRAEITGWESGLSFAAYRHDVLLYGLYHEAFEGVFIWTNNGEPSLLLEAGEMTGEYVRGVTTTGDEATGVVLIETAAGFPDLPAARLLFVDLSLGTVALEVAVPLQLAAEDSWHVPRDISAAGGLLLVNRYAEGSWLAPLVHDLASGEWAVLEGIEGRAFL